MNLFIGSSANDTVLEKYESSVKELLDKVSKINNLNLVFGASFTGLMGKCAESFRQNNKKLIGVTINNYKDNIAESNYDSIYYGNSPVKRTEKLYELSDVFLIIPGGFGTLTELFSFIIENEEMNNNKPIIIYNKDFFFTPLLEYLFKLREEKFIRNDLSEYIFISNDIDEIVEKIKKEGNV